MRIRCVLDSDLLNSKGIAIVLDPFICVAVYQKLMLQDNFRHLIRVIMNSSRDR